MRTSWTMLRIAVVGVRLLAASFLFGRPASASVPDARMLMPVTPLRQVTSPFGQRHDGFHPGIDLAAPYGSPGVAAEEGTIVSERREVEYGIVLDLRGRTGVVTRYAHLASVAPSVRSGSRVRRGEKLGSVGETGNANGPHLHFEVRIAATAVDPAPYMVRSNTIARVQLAAAGRSPGSRHRQRNAHIRR